MDLGIRRLDRWMHWDGIGSTEGGKGGHSANTHASKDVHEIQVIVSTTYTHQITAIIVHIYI